MESGDRSERRAYTRFPAEVAVQAQAIADSAKTEGTHTHRYISRDVSQSGMRLWGNQLFPVDAVLLLTFECHEFGWQNVISRLGAVVWTEELSTTGAYLLGIRFVEDLLPKIPTPATV